MQANETQRNLVRSARLSVRKAGGKMVYTVFLDGEQIGTRRSHVAYRAVRVFLGPTGASVCGFHKKVSTAVREASLAMQQPGEGVVFAVQVDHEGEAVLQAIEAGWRADQARARRAAEREQAKAESDRRTADGLDDPDVCTLGKTPHPDDDVFESKEQRARADGARSPRLGSEEAAEALFRLAAYVDDLGHSYKTFEVVADIREIAGRLRS